MITSRTNSRFRPTSRAGLTLAEVLVSVLVMSIGVVSLMSLFPIATLRALQATNLTNAVTLRENIDGLLITRPQLGVVESLWQANTPVSLGTIFVPTNEFVREVLGVNALVCTVAGNTGNFEPSWTIGPYPLVDGTARWELAPFPSYIVDPLGAKLVDAPAGALTQFGNNGAVAMALQPRFAQVGVIGVDSTAVTAEALARQIVTLPDSWVKQFESERLVPSDSNPDLRPPGATDRLRLTDLTELVDSTLPGDAALMAINPQFSRLRIVAFDEAGRESQTRFVTAVTGTVGNQSFDLDRPLPANFAPVKVRLDIREQRYSFFLSCRRSSKGVDRDAVVFFRRRFEPVDEQLFLASFNKAIDPGLDGQPGFAGVDDDLDGTVDNSTELERVGSDDEPRAWAIVAFDANTTTRLPIKKGGFVCDYVNLKWYKVVNYTDAYPDLTPANATVDLDLRLLPRGVTTAQAGDLSHLRKVADGGQFPDTADIRYQRIIFAPEQPVAIDNSNLVPANRAAMFPRNVVDVFPIGLLAY